MQENADYYGFHYFSKNIEEDDVEAKAVDHYDEANPENGTPSHQDKANLGHRTGMAGAKILSSQE